MLTKKFAAAKADAPDCAGLFETTHRITLAFRGRAMSERAHTMSKAEETTTGAGWIDPSSYPELQSLVKHWLFVRDDLLSVLKSRSPWVRFTDNDSVHNLRFKSQSEVNKLIGPLLVPIEDPTPHKLFPLFREKESFSLAANLCKTTVGLVTGITGAFNAAFASLEPNGHIIPHRGSSERVDRCHLGLIVPIGDAGIRVEYVTRSWAEGGLLLFDDSSLHEAWNNTHERRIVLIVDMEKAKSQSRQLWRV